MSNFCLAPLKPNTGDMVVRIKESKNILNVNIDYIKHK